VLADCQVLIARGPAGQEPLSPAEISKLMVAVDLSLEAVAAVAAVERLAPALDACVLVVHVTDARFGNGGPSSLEIEDGARAMVRRAKQRLRP
jgi:hypothetical protein